MWILYSLLLLFTSPVSHGHTILNGTFLHFGYPNQEELPLSEVPRYFELLEKLGMDTLVIEATKHKTGGCRENKTDWVKGFPGKLYPILEEARKRKFNIYLGLLSTMNSCPEFYAPPNSKFAIGETAKLVSEFLPLFKKYRELKGWYIPDEPGHLEEFYFSYFRGLVKVIRRSSLHPIVVSPYLKDLVGKITPGEVAGRARLFKKTTGVDIQAWQDSVGADGVLDKKSYIQSLSRALEPSGFWATVELFNWGKDLLKGGGYTATSLSRLNAQLAQANDRYTQIRLSWLGQIHLTKLPLRDGYKNGTITPHAYFYLTPPSSTYPDDKNKLFNKVTASPINYLDQEWVGILGETDIVFDLGEKKEINWISIHLLHQSAEGISFPHKLQIYCDDVFLRIDHLPIEVADSEFVFSNQKALNSSCQKVRIKLSNLQWTFLSEIEFIK